MTDTYNAENPTQHTEEDCQNAVGKRADIHFTGTIIGVGQMGDGFYSVFKPDERFGLDPEFIMGFDLEAYTLGEVDPNFEHPITVHEDGSIEGDVVDNEVELPALEAGQVPEWVKEDTEISSAQIDTDNLIEELNDDTVIGGE